jgi:hypothetical protein
VGGSLYYAANTEPWDRAFSEGYDWVRLGENIAGGYTNGQATDDGWFRSMGHRTNMIDDTILEIGVGYVFYIPSAFGTYWVADFATRYLSAEHFFTGTVFDDVNGSRAYDEGEGVGGIEVRLRTPVGVHTWFDRTTAAGSFAIPIQDVADGALVEVLLKNTSGAARTLHIPVDYSRLATVTLGSGQSYAYGTFTQPSTQRNVGFRDVSAYLLRPSVMLPVSFPGRWVGVLVWDAGAAQWIVSENQYAPSRITVRDIEMNRWYHVGLFDYFAGTWAFGEWFGRLQ